MRAVLLAVGITLAACGPEGEDVVCVSGIGGPGQSRVRIDAPAVGDTLILGDPFPVEIGVEAVGEVRDVWVQLHWLPDGGEVGLDERVVYRRDVSTGSARYAARFLVQIDSLPGQASADSLGERGRFLFGVYGEQGTACTGMDDDELFGWVGASAPVTVLDRPPRPTP